MPLKSFFIIGLQVLLLTHIAHTFVLLTANIDDIKKLANKFVSPDVADQITQIINKINVNDAKIDINISEENEKNQQSGVSGEDISKNNNIAIQSDNPAENKRTEKKKPVNNFQSKHKYNGLNDLFKSGLDRTGIESDPNNNDRKVDTKLVTSTLRPLGSPAKLPWGIATTDSHKDIPSNGHSVIADYEAKLAHIMLAAKGSRKPHKRMRNKPTSTAHILSTAGYAVKYGEARNLVPNRSKFTLQNSHEKPESSKLADTRYPVNDRAQLTSRKEKTEFDQYDYTKYPIRFFTKDREVHPKEAQVE